MVNSDWLGGGVRIATLATGISGAKKENEFEFLAAFEKDFWRV